MMYCLLLICLIGKASSDVINTSSGPIRGISSRAEDVEAFLGIPYAEPPVGELRFAKPVPKKKWIDIYNASNFGPPCTQASVHPHYYIPDLRNMSEDCLYLNVWAPKTKPSKGLRPIIIYLHSGGFITGSSTVKEHDGSQLASRGDLVVASMNYRLGLLGYFLSYTEEANGNMGEFDKIMAIEWIKENAKHFNGDPDNIILMGASAGAISITGFIVSPLTKNLFRRAIIISGSLYHPFLGDNDKLFAISERIAFIAGCSNDSVTLQNDPKTIIKCLKRKPIEDLIKIQNTLINMNPIVFFPRVGDELLPKRAVELFREGDFRKEVDILMGVTEDEGSLFLFTAIPEYVGVYGRSVGKMTKMRAFTFIRGFFFITGENKSSEITDYYMKQAKNNRTTGYVRLVSNFIGDFATSCCVVFNADIISQKGNQVYFYKFNFRPISSPAAEWVGSMHVDDVPYIFGNPYEGNFSDVEIDLSHRFIDRWSAFARTGNPNIEGTVPWPRYSYQSPVYLHIGQEEESIRLRPNRRCEIWRKRFNADVDDELTKNLQILEIK